MGAGQAKEEWKNFRIGEKIPSNALIAGKIKGEKVYVGRVTTRTSGLLMVAYYETQMKAFTSINGRVEPVHTTFELFTGHGHIWVSTHQFSIPKGAVGVGVNADGNTLYIGRVRTLDKRDKTQEMQLVSVNPKIKALGKLNNLPEITMLENTCQLLVEAPAALKLTDADLQTSMTASVSVKDEKALSVSKHLVNHLKVRYKLKS